ncbi:MAG: enoyl-CoA hydratase [Candidatus Eisenbacteria bacterium]|nr:enoyl-CoA hydratase [Candidatus Eisenbacteria bacterium]
MSWETLLLEKDPPVAVVTVNRPDKLNALNAQAFNDLYDAFKRLGQDDEVRVVIVTGSGEKAFVAGADIKELAEMSAREGKELSLRGQKVFDLVENCGKPTIAAINGYALGGGCELALACTLRIATESARIGFPEVTLGLIPGYAGTQRLPRIVGKGRALELILSGVPAKARQAHEMGLVNRVVPGEELLTAARELAGTIAQRGPLALRYAMEAVHQGLESPFAEAARLEANLFGLLFATEDMHEGTRAFLEKRQADFKNR